MEDLVCDLIYIAFDQHCLDGHNADFEVCDDPRCLRAYSLEVAYHRRQEWMDGEPAFNL